MKRLLMFLFGVFLLFGLATNASATLYSFTGTDAGGTGSALMNIDIVGMQLTLTLENTSPETLDSGTGVNTPGITGFGFNLLNEWSATPIPAFELVAVDGVDWWNDWLMLTDTSFAGISANLMFQTTSGNIKGALYNPEASIGFGALPNYTTPVELMLTFEEAPLLDEESLFVRMQNVGLDGDGSLKLSLTPVPEPATMLLMGCGLLGLGVFGRKKFLKSV